MTADEITVRDLLESEVGALHTKIDALGEQLAAVASALDQRITGVNDAARLQNAELRADLGRVHEITAATNGRVRKIELWQAKIQGVSLAIGRVPTLLASLAALASIAAIVVAITR